MRDKADVSIWGPEVPFRPAAELQGKPHRRRRNYPCFDVRLGGMSGGNETQG
jgi:hypothetical protein